MTLMTDYYFYQDFMNVMWEELDHRGLTPLPETYTVMVKGLAFVDHDRATDVVKSAKVSVSKDSALEIAPHS